MKNSPSENPASLEQRLIQLLGERGSVDPEIMELLKCKQDELIAASVTPTEGLFQFDLWKARLCLAAGYREEALEDFEAARVRAWNERWEERYQAIMREMDEAEGSV